MSDTDEFNESDLPLVDDRLNPHASDGHQATSSHLPRVRILEIAELGHLELGVHTIHRDGKAEIRVAFGDIEHVDRVDCGSAQARARVVNALAVKLDVSPDALRRIVDDELIRIHGASRTSTEELATDSASFESDVLDRCALWKTPDSVAFATFEVGDHRETWPVLSKRFERYLVADAFTRLNVVPKSEDLSSAIRLAESVALFKGETHEAHVRVAEVEDRIYIDLCDDSWRVIEITSNGWAVVEDSPVRFRRSSSMCKLPLPARGGSVDELRPFLNLDEDDWKLNIGWLVGALRERGPFAILMYTALYGSGKSTAARLTRDLVDPNTAPLRTMSRSERDLAIAANNSWAQVFDNLSELKEWSSNALCRLATGGGLATRELYTNTDETIFYARRPCILTSIEDVATRGDLGSRGIFVNLPHIPPERRRPESELLAAFENVRPRVLGALFDAVATALRNLPTTRLDRLPRMADFVTWVTAAEPALGWTPGSFLNAFERNREVATAVAMDASPIASALLHLLEVEGPWDGSPTDLLAALERAADDRVKSSRSWPGGAQVLSRHLALLAPNLLEVGWRVESYRTTDRRRRRMLGIVRVEGGADASDASDASAGTDSAGSTAPSPPTESEAPDSSLRLSEEETYVTGRGIEAESGRRTPSSGPASSCSSVRSVRSVRNQPQDHPDEGVTDRTLPGALASEKRPVRTVASASPDASDDCRTIDDDAKRPRRIRL